MVDLATGAGESEMAISGRVTVEGFREGAVGSDILGLDEDEVINSISNLRR